MEAVQAIIDQAWENRAGLSPASADRGIRDAVESVIARLDRGELRVAAKAGGQWQTHQWIKKAVLLSFRLHDNRMMRAGDLGFFDKVATKFAHLDEAAMRATGVRVVPPAVARIWSSSRWANLVATLSKKPRSPARMARFSCRRKLSSTAFLIH